MGHLTEDRSQGAHISGKVLDNMRVALLNDWLIHLRGQERVFQALVEGFPAADILSLAYAPQAMPEAFRTRTVHTSFVQHLPAAHRMFRAYLPLYPLAVKLLDVSKYDVVLASSSAFVHGVVTRRDAPLICYCHTPFRYIWSHYDELVGSRVGALRHATVPLRAALRRCDVRAARRVDAFVAPSRLVAERIRAFYGRESTIIRPPVDLEVFKPARSAGKDYFLIVSPLMRWKRVDIAIDAFNRLGLPLKVVGGGEESARLRRMARANIEFLGPLSHLETGTLARLYCECRALVVPSAEDFGLAPLEAMASGRPVIALGAGGALETVVDGTTGIFFRKQTATALMEAIVGFDNSTFDSTLLRRHAGLFGTQKFMEEIKACIESQLRK